MIKASKQTMNLRIAALFVFIGFLTGCATITRQYQAWSEYQRALNLFKAEKYGEAPEHVEEALVQLPEQPEFLALSGWTFLKQSRIEEARRLFSRSCWARATSALACSSLKPRTFKTVSREKRKRPTGLMRQRSRPVLLGPGPGRPPPLLPGADSL